VVVSRLTAQGREKIAAKRSAWQKRWQQALGDVSERDLRAATLVLAQLGRMFDEGQPQGACEPTDEASQSAPQGP
jgi:hypothetical protein